MEYASSATSGKVCIYGHTLISQGNSWYYLYNAHGDVVKYTNANGAVLQSYDYDAFGEEADPSTTDANPFRYAGQYFDDETGTYYLRARYYNPGNGRFSQEDTHWNTGNMLYGDDPIKLGEYLKPSMDAILQSSNLYVYCISNPVKYVDVSGDIIGEAGAAALAASAANIWNPVGWIFVAAIVVVGIGWGVSIYNAQKKKPVNLPSLKKVKINMEYILSGHSAGGNRGGPNKDRFPIEMTAPAIEKAIREAYQCAQKIGEMQYSWQNGVEMIRQLFEGTWSGGKIQFWYNYVTKTIESAWPK